MEEKDLDRLFKKEKEHESVNPPDFIWDNLENDLRKNRRRKRFVWFWFFGAVGLMFAAWFYLSTKEYDPKQEISVENSTINREISDSDVVHDLTTIWVLVVA